ncbi:MAG: ferric reductase-like transmembrane domain-containing protein [Cyanobacteria bacterium P01_A01_bin.40]
MKNKFKTVDKSQKAKQKRQQPLFPHGDWIAIVMGVAVLSQMDGMGHHLGHAGIFFLMLALIARPIRGFWQQPLKHRRAIGIFAFAATLAHAIYAFCNVLNCDPKVILDMTSRHQWGIWAGIISLAIITPAAVTSFRFFQQKLGRKWRQIHLLSVPALALAVLHTVLIGPHYLAQFQIEMLDHLRTYAIVIMTFLVLLVRRKIFWSILRFLKIIN